MKKAIVGIAAVGAVVGLLSGLRRRSGSLREQSGQMAVHCKQMAAECRRMAAEVGGSRQA